MFTMQKIKKNIKYWQNTFQVFVKVKNKVIFIKKTLVKQILEYSYRTKKKHIFYICNKC